MRKYILPSLLVMLLFPLPFRGDQPEEKRILILNSYHPGMLWEGSIRDALLRELEKQGVVCSVHEEFMDTKHHDSPEYEQHLFNLLAHKYRKLKPDAVVAVDDAAYRFLLRYRDRIMGRIPVVFCGVNWYDPAEIAGKWGYTGVMERLDIAGTLALARALQPGLDTVHLVNDTTLTGILNERVLAALAADKNMPRIVHIPLLPMDRLQQHLATIRGNQAILLLTFNRDASGRTFTYRESIQRITQAAAVPVYGVWDFYLNRGITGGSITAGADQGRLVAGQLVRILGGEDPERIPVNTGAPFHSVLDYRMARRFQLETGKLPPGTRLINRPDRSLRIPRVVLGILVTILVLTAVLVVLLLRRLRIEREFGKAAEQTGLSYRLLSRILEKRVAERTGMLVQTNEVLRSSLVEMEQEANAAKNIQLRLLPQTEAVLGGFVFQHLLRPSQTVSGDFVDYFSINDTTVGFYCADVSGHGLSAAFITVFLKGQIDLQLEKYRLGTASLILEPAALLTELNQTIIHYNLGKHIALFYGILEAGGPLRCSNAGQYPFPLLRHSGKTMPLEIKSPPLGLFPESRYTDSTYQVTEDFSLTIFSDGILDILPPAPLLEKEKQLLEMVAGGPATAAYYAATLGLQERVNSADDLTILTIAGTGV